MKISEALRLTLKFWKSSDVAQCRFHQCFGGRLAILLLQLLLQRTGVDADTDRYVLVTGCVNQCAHAIFLADIARVDAQAIDAELQDAQGDLVIEVNVADERHLHLLADLAECFGGLHRRDRDAHDVGTDRLEGTDLRHRCRHIAGLGIGHALHRDRRIAAYGDVAYHDLPRLAPHDGGRMMHLDYLTRGRLS